MLGMSLLTGRVSPITAQNLPTGRRILKLGRTSADMHASPVFHTSSLLWAPGQKVHESAFEKVTAYFHETERSSFCPFGQERKVQVGMEQWKKWCLFLRHIRHRHPITEDILHLLSLGSLYPGSHEGRWYGCDPRFINNFRNTRCVQCMQDEEETLQPFCRVRSCRTRLASSLPGTPPILRRFGLPSCNEGHERHQHPESGLCALCLPAVSSLQRGSAGGNHGS
ncbi:hypothetical protein BCR37DRAFT_375667 [Protomyces lactucae-debilis]|uniref:Uncharacterized protein n=1 Tax=Protomyces lactucae-debilis TaxID=2754530 RepID=A0A1Y2FYM8_PROLT|nr:uncharacterized protein BCR37DRAFT_375667 [Protomyces lactucae-debilis]ORY87775.1 hypothetical protein BCR37DRAFT_375667 [Protomyces lactucae-debilis]